MEFVATLLLLYLMQCAAYLPREALLFSRSLRDWRIRTATGWRLLHVRPSANWLYATRFALRMRDGKLYARSPASRFGWRAPGARGAVVEFGGTEALDLRGRLVRVDGRPFCRALSKRGARRMLHWLRQLEEGGEDLVRTHVEAALAASLSLAAFREQFETFKSSTRALGWLCDSYFCFLFVGVPGLILLAHEERGLLIAFTTIALLHVVTLVALALAHRRLYPEDPGELFELVLSAAFYPPILLRARGEFATDLLAAFHPVVAAAALLPDGPRRRFFRAQLLRLEREVAATPEPDAMPELERRAVLDLLEACGVTRDDLMQPPPRDDAQALAFCPICAVDYVRTEGQCGDCGVELIAYTS